MLNRKGIIGTDIVMKAMMGVLALGLGVALISPGGSFFESLSEGLGLVDQQVGSTITVDDKQTFSDAAKYVYHRASNGGCAEGGPVDQQNQEGGYPGLEDTYLDLKPPCAGSQGGSLAGATNTLGGDSGNDMEGVFSRVEFEIPTDRDGPITFTKSGDTWIENNYLAASQEGFYNKIANECTEGALPAYLNNVQVGLEIRYFGTASNYNFFFQSSDTDGRSNLWMSDKNLNDAVYCGLDFPDAGLLTDSPVAKKFVDEDVEIALCPGDKGYIQMNKGYTSGEGPNNKAEASKGLTDSETYYPFVQITETGDCRGGLYEDNLEFEVIQDPKMVEDRLSVSLNGLFEYDDQVRFDFIKNNDLVYQETVNVEDSSALLELTPAENEMNVGSYTVKPTILRCDEDGSGCENQNVDITTSFEIENYKYFDDYLPAEFGISGTREILISFENERDYSGSEPVNIKYFDYKVDLDLEYVSLNDGPDNRCKLTMADQDTVNNDHGAVFFAQGDIIEKEGSLPSREGIPQDKTGGGPGDDSVWPVYDNFELDGSLWQRASGFLGSETSMRTLLVESNEGNRLEMVGDLMCAKPIEEAEKASWILCDESNMREGATFGEEYTLEADGNQYVCDPNEGEWSLAEE